MRTARGTPTRCGHRTYRRKLVEHVPNLVIGIRIQTRASAACPPAPMGAARAAVHISPHLQRASTVPAPGLGASRPLRSCPRAGRAPEPHTHATNHMRPPRLGPVTRD